MLQDTVKYGTFREGTTRSFFTHSIDPDYKRMDEKMLADPNSGVTSIDEGLKRVRDSNGRYALIVEGVSAEYYVNQPPCDLVMVNAELGDQKRHAMALRKGDPLKGRIDVVLDEWIQNGELKALRGKYWVKDAACNGGDGTVTIVSKYMMLMSAAAVLAAARIVSV